MNKENKTEKNKFRIFLKIYILILIIFTIIATIYVYSTLKTYERNDISNYMESVISDLKSYANKKEVNKHINNINIKKGDFEKDNANIENGLNSIFSSDANFSFKINENSKDELKPVYDIYANNNKILEVGLDGSNIETRLSLLTFSNWKVSYINVEAENGLFTYEISVPSNYKVSVNDKTLTENEIVKSNLDAGLTEISKYIEIPYLINYKVKGLIEPPTARITDKNGNEIDKKDIQYNDEVLKFETLDEAKKEIKNIPDIMHIAEDWSLFLSSDLSRQKLWFLQHS